MEDYFERLYGVVDGLNTRFAGGGGPFQMMTRLCEEVGELAKEVNHFEGMGVKMEKHGAPDREKLAKEVRDVLIATLSVARHYGIENELKRVIDERFGSLKQEGYIE